MHFDSYSLPWLSCRARQAWISVPGLRLAVTEFRHKMPRKRGAGGGVTGQLGTTVSGHVSREGCKLGVPTALTCVQYRPGAPRGAPGEPALRIAGARASPEAAAASPSRGGSGRRQRRAAAAQPPAALPLGRNGRWVPGEASCGSESPGELLNHSLPQSWESVRRELPGDCAARRGTRYFPSECSGR